MAAIRFSPFALRYNAAMKLLRSIGLYLGHLLTALIGTAILRFPLEKILRQRSISGVIWREWILSIVCAGLIGFLTYRTWRSKIGMWVWALPTAWFGFGVLMLLGTIHAQSALSPNHGLWYEISGQSCAAGMVEIGCRVFFLCTIPLLRSTGYSVGTLIGWRLVGRGSHALKRKAAQSMTDN